MNEPVHSAFAIFQQFLALAAAACEAGKCDRELVYFGGCCVRAASIAHARRRGHGRAAGSDEERENENDFAQ